MQAFSLQDRDLRLRLEDVLLGRLAHRVAGFGDLQELVEQIDVAAQYVHSGKRIRPAKVGLLDPGDHAQLRLLVLLPFCLGFLDRHVAGQLALSGERDLLRDHHPDVAGHVGPEPRARPGPPAAVVAGGKHRIRQATELTRLRTIGKSLGQ